jgi:hypothetical protein
MPKHKAKQLECSWGEEAFALAVQTTLDGDRIAAEKTKSEADRKAAEANQAELLHDLEDAAKQQHQSV